jgi:hypothetical protein
MKDQEHIEQSMLVVWFRLQYPKLTMFAVPNGGLRHIRTASKLKKEGALAGVADLFLMKPSKEYAGLFIEMKAPSGRLTTMQSSFLTKAETEGYQAKVCFGFEEAKRVIESYLNA